MQMLPCFIHLVASVAASALLASVWQGALLVMFVALALRAFQGLSAAVRSAIWTAVLVVVAGLPVLAVSLPHSAHASAASHIGLRVNAAWSVGLLSVWLAAAAFRLVQLGLSALRVWSLGRRAVPVPIDAGLAALLADAKRNVQLCTSNDVDRPSVAGFLRSRILLPPDTLAKLTPDEVKLVVLHEMEHLRRRDEWTNLLQKLALAVFPFHPVLVWLDRRLCLERELACDDGVLRQTLARKAYATVLARLAEDRMVSRGMALVLGALGVRQSELGRRVHSILFAPVAAMGQVQARATTAVMVMGVAAVSLGLARVPQLVSFVSPADSTLQVQAANVAPAAPFAPVQAASVYVPASFVAARSSAWPVLMRATMPVVKKPSRRLNAPRLQQVAYDLPEREQAVTQWVVVTTSWRPVAVAPVLTTVSVDREAAYAAVATRDGWVIVQL